MLARLLGLLLLLVFVMNSSYAAKKGGSKESLGINNETLTGGIVHNEGFFLPRGLTIPVELRSPIDSRVSKQGDQITVQVSEDVMIGDYVIIPANTFVHGYISRFEEAAKWRKDPVIELKFDNLSIKLPEEQGRRYISINGVINPKDTLLKGEKVSDSKLYKDKAKKAKKLGGIGGGVTAYAYTQYVTPFAGLGIGGMLNNLLIMGGGVGGAMLATSLLTRDDIRLEPGTQFKIRLNEPSIENFEAKHLLSYDQTHEVQPIVKEEKVEELYDAYTTLESEKLEELETTIKKASAKAI